MMPDPMSRIEDLLREMTLTEKLGQLTMAASSEAITGPVVAGDLRDGVRNGTVGNVLNLYGAERVQNLQRIAVEESRLRIPLLIGLDVIHGYRTLFPVGLAEASLFDPELWSLTAREAAREAAHDGIAMTFAPMLDVSRDPRWGRSVEGPGEDPWVGARLAEAKVRGFQGQTLADAGSIAAVAKHYCAYGSVTAGREYASVDVSERTVLEVHLPPFAAAVAAGVAAVMPAFTDLAGVPMTAHVPLLRGWLRERLGFKGVLVSDYNSIGELLLHGVAADLAEAAALALRAGVDIDMMANAYLQGLPLALQRGLVDSTLIDEAVRRVLRLKEQLGLFDDPYARGARPEPVADIAQRRRVARTVAGKAVLLLTNRAGTLPLRNDLRALALIGPLADAAAEMRGSWWAASQPGDAVSVHAGLQAALPDTHIRHVAGVPIEAGDSEEIAAALAACEDADAIVLCVGEAAVMSGEAASRAYLDLPGRQRQLAEAVLAQARQRGCPLIAVLFSGRPLIVPWLIEQADAVVAAWFLGSEAGHALADVLTGRISPTARTPVSWPRAMGQIPLFFAQRPTGRPGDATNHYSSRYLDVPNDPLFPFGHGLSYTRFRLEDLRVTPRSLGPSDRLNVSVDVINEGARAGEETVFVFVHDMIASVVRPLLELKGWGRIDLAPGERGTVSLQLPASELRFLDQELRPVFEPGEIEILVGPCADRARLLVERIHLIA
jgi:beta-glucosidase